MPNEERALVLDYLAKGKPNSYKSEPVAQVLGEQFFTLLEVVPKKELKVMESIYVGKDERAEIDYIKRRINSDELTSTAAAELEKAIEKIVEENTARFLEFYNTAGPITLRRHQLELLPGFGKKHMQDIIRERQKKPFESFEDLNKRVKLLPDTFKAIVKRIEFELREPNLNHYLFVRPPVKERAFGRR
ncbi:MAG: DUF655 domain-containing protein [Candidatus Diapherotrites archaeon]|uniref:DUF655 domain-containing protein n=1 Tax=Candidatus Iainarchaeum sp. TaxID=3101447 RepID=A0A938YTF4_9ARCH|nr:DUF655 domain-containing protein [Candidatus Diapherotrites archaeon]